MSKSRVYFYLQKLKDRTADIINTTRFVSYQNNNNQRYPIFNPSFPVLLLTENKRKLLPVNEIQNKTCNNCKFYIDKDNYNPNNFYIYDGIGICYYKHGLFGVKNGIFASVVRLDDKLCGKSGKWFEKRE